MNPWLEAADLLGAVLLLLGCVQCLIGVIGMLRFPDVLTRSHAATKPQTIGVLLALAGVTLRLRDPIDLGTLGLIVFFQFLTSPVASHLVARSAYRTGQTGSRGLLRDDLDPQLGEGDD
ncbi:monovalent cation/H(+) antiporter subunit G [Streptomyces sp. SCSIO 75703]|uniref:monovalent cation/H(+) antiporter subunit G n=1 Tax=unclassified Streptomyces TaxID=2593676 RepID=UPI0004C29B04|nr:MULTISPECIES: monovalent cation/H(+) antiporter subunit G [unclassified Streptomyces]